MGFGLAIGLVLLAMTLGLLVDVADTAQPVQVPPDVQFPKGNSSPGRVTFSHRLHQARVDNCGLCHAKGSTAAGSVTTLKQACSACHDGKTAIGRTVVFSINECDRCHKP